MPIASTTRNSPQDQPQESQTAGRRPDRRCISGDDVAVLRSPILSVFQRARGPFPPARGTREWRCRLGVPTLGARLPRQASTLVGGWRGGIGSWLGILG